jgi:hypothetical protein
MDEFEDIELRAVSAATHGAVDNHSFCNEQRHFANQSSFEHYTPDK